VLQKYDGPSTFHFLDPPYWERKLYAFNFTRTDFESLPERLKVLKGKFLMTLDDKPEIRQIFGSFRLTPSRSLTAPSGGPAASMTNC
jgi:DNA adenine methylase